MAPASREAACREPARTFSPRHFFRSFYDQHMYHPLLVLDGENGELVSVLLRQGSPSIGPASGPGSSQWKRSRGTAPRRSRDARVLIDGSPWNCLALSMSVIAATAIDSRAFGGIVYNPRSPEASQMPNSTVEEGNCLRIRSRGNQVLSRYSSLFAILTAAAPFQVASPPCGGSKSVQAVSSRRLFTGTLADVEVEKVLFAFPDRSRFFIGVNIVNKTHRVLGIDLSDRNKVLYPNQWAMSSDERRQGVDELRSAHQTMNAEAKAALIARFRARSLATIDPRRTIVYFHDLSGPGDLSAALADSQNANAWFIVSIDGQLQLTDGVDVENFHFEQDWDPSKTDVAIALEHPIRPVPLLGWIFVDDLVWGDATDGWAVSLLPSKSHYPQWEPVLLSVFLRNIDQHPAQIPHRNVWNSYRFEVRREGSKGALQVKREIGPDSATLWEAQPGMVEVHSLDLSVGVHLPPGKYRLSAAREVSKRISAKRFSTAHSKETTIEVEAAQPITDAQRSAFLKALESVKVGWTRDQLLGELGTPDSQSANQWTYRWEEGLGGLFKTFRFTLENDAVIKVDQNGGCTVIE
jgi:hypothetical protein